MDSYIPYEDLDFMLYAGLGVVSIFAVIWLCMFVFIKLTGGKNEAIEAKQPPQTAPKASNLERSSGKGQGYISQGENPQSQHVREQSNKNKACVNRAGELDESNHHLNYLSARNKEQLRQVRNRHVFLWFISIIIGGICPPILVALFLFLKLFGSRPNYFEKDEEYKRIFLTHGGNINIANEDLPISIWR